MLPLLEVRKVKRVRRPFRKGRKPTFIWKVAALTIRRLRLNKIFTRSMGSTFPPTSPHGNRRKFQGRFHSDVARLFFAPVWSDRFDPFNGRDPSEKSVPQSECNSLTFRFFLFTARRTRQLFSSFSRHCYGGHEENYSLSYRPAGIGFVRPVLDV